MRNLMATNAFIAVILLGGAGALILLSRSWRWRLGALAFLYLGVFWLVAISWPFTLASVKLVAGWMAAAILGISRVNLLPSDRPRWPTERLFVGLVVLVVGISASTMETTVATWIPNIRPAQAWGAIFLIGIGLINLGFASRGLQVVTSLLIALSGFEIVYAVVESSTLVAGLLAIVNIGVALVGAYLLGNLPDEEDV